MFSELTEEDLKGEVDIPLGHRLLLRKHLQRPSLSPPSKTKPTSLTFSLSSHSLHTQAVSQTPFTQQTSPCAPQKKPTTFSASNSLSYTHTSHTTTSSPLSMSAPPSPSVPNSLSPSSSSLGSSSLAHLPKEKHTGIVLKSRVITEMSMEGLLREKAFVDIKDISRYESERESKSEAAMWFTVGVLTEKSHKTSSSGKEFLIAKLSNFSAEFAKLAEISLFLFDKDKDLLERDACGLILGVISPKITNNSKGVSLTLSSNNSLLKIGHALHFGRCKALRRSDGRKCDNAINTKMSTFCDFHVTSNAKSSTRMEIAGSECGGGTKRKAPFLSDKPAKKQKVGTGIVGPNLLENAVSRLKNGQSALPTSRAGLPQMPVPSSTMPSPSVPHSKESAVDILCRTLVKETPGARNLRRAGGLATARELNEIEFAGKRRIGELASQSAFIHPNFTLKQTTPLSTAPSKSVSISMGDFANTQRIQKLEKLIRSQGGLPNPSTNPKPTPSPLLSTTSSPKPQEAKPTPPSSKLSAKQAEALLSRQSQFADAADEKLNSERTKRFEEICRKEARQEELSQLHEITVKVVHCLTCGYVDEVPAPLCRQLGHDLKSNLKAKKRFFSCSTCGWRTCTYKSIIPLSPCVKCGAATFTKVGMAREPRKEKPVQIEDATELLPRGVEHGKFTSTRY